MNDFTPIGAAFGFVNDFAEIDGVRLHYRLGGDPKGAPVLLWHGFLGTGHTWRRVAPALAEAGLAVLVPDMRGYGGSDKPAGTAGYDGRALAGEFRALARQLDFGGGRPLTLVAHDMGAPPALLWAADHPDEIAALFYLDEPVMLLPVLQHIMTYSPAIANSGGLWWWPFALAPGAAEALVVGNERGFLQWFYDRATVTPGAITPADVDEYLRSFRGRDGVLGAMGVYRAAFTTIEQTAPLAEAKLRVPVIALGGDRGQGTKVRDMLMLVAEDVDGGAVEKCGHFIPEERPDEIVRLVLARLATTVA